MTRTLSSVIAGAAKVLRIAVAVIVVAAYTAFAHGFSTATQVPALWFPLAALPLCTLLLLRREWRKYGAALLAAMIVIAMNPSWRNASTQHLAWLYFVQDSALNIGLALLFGSTLRPGALPLCSRIALLLQPQTSARALRYTRAATWAWTLFFIAMTTTSALLFFGASHAVWSMFANLLYWPLLIAMFALEYAARWLCLPRADRPTLSATIAAFARMQDTPMNTKGPAS